MRQTRRSAAAAYGIAALIASILAGCDSTGTPVTPDTGLNPATQTTSPSRLKFADAAAFEAYLTPLIDAPTADLAAAEQRNGLHSLRAYLDAGEDTEAGARDALAGGSTGGSAETAYKADGVARRDFVVGDAFLSALNARGEIQIADSIYKVTRDNVYAVAPENLDLLNAKVPTLSSPRPAEGDPRIVVHPVETTLPPPETEQPATGPTVAAAAGLEAASRHVISGVGPNCFVYPTWDRRMHGQSYISNYVIFLQAGVITRWQRRIWWFFWVNHGQSGTLTHRYDARVYVGGMTVWSGVGGLTATGTSQIHTSLGFSFFGLPLTGHIHGYHFYSNNYGNGSCQTAV